MEKNIQIKFREETERGTYSDCLYFPEDEYNKLTEEDIRKLIQDRVNNWLAFVSTPPQPIEKTEEELIADKKLYEEQIREKEEMLALVDSELSLKARK